MSALEGLRAWYDGAKDTPEGRLALKWRRAMAPDAVEVLKAGYPGQASDEELELAIVRRLFGELEDAMVGGRRALLEAEITALAARTRTLEGDLGELATDHERLEAMLQDERADHARTRAALEAAHHEAMQGWGKAAEERDAALALVKELEAARAALVPVSHVDPAPLPLEPVAEEPEPEAPPAEAGPVTRKDSSRKPSR